MKLEFIQTNIVNVSADAIVLPANTMLKEGSGASTAIFEAAGRRKLTQACKKIGSCPVGSAVPTLAFNLNAKYIIHAVVSKWIDGNQGEYDLLSSAYLSSLKIADVMGCQSIAFPLLASGNNGYDKELAFQIAKESIESFEGSSLKKAGLVVYGSRITAWLREQGYEVIEIPEDLEKERRKQAHKEKAKQFAEEGKEIAYRFLEDQIQKGLDYLKVKENREELLEKAMEKVNEAKSKKEKKNIK